MEALFQFHISLFLTLSSSDFEREREREESEFVEITIFNRKPWGLIDYEGCGSIVKTKAKVESPGIYFSLQCN
jgi:hypothetical protein